VKPNALWPTQQKFWVGHGPTLQSINIRLIRGSYAIAKITARCALGTIRYDTIEEFNVDSKAEYSALSSTRSQKRNTNKQRQCPFNTVQVKNREVSPEGIRVMEEMICERDEF